MSKRRFNEKQIAALEYLSLPRRGDMTYEQIAKAVGIDERQLYRWRKDDVFAAELNRRVVLGLSDRLPDIVESIPDHIIREGNAAMLRTTLQALGLLTEKVEVNNTGDANSVDDMKAEIERIRGK